MAYVTGYKRPRPAEYEMPPYGHADYGQYAPPPDYGQMGGPPNVPHNLPPNVPHNMPQHMPHNAPPNIPPPAMQPVPAQPPPPESLRLGSAPDGTMPVVKLRGLPFSCDIESINMFLVSFRDVLQRLKKSKVKLINLIPPCTSCLLRIIFAVLLVL